MAKATTQIVKETSRAEADQAKAQQEIMQALTEQKEAVLQLLQLVRDLKESGMLEMAHAFMSNRHQIGVIGINQLNKSGAQNLIKNGMGAVQFLGQLEPERLEFMLGALASGVEHAAQKRNRRERIGLWRMLGAFKETEIRQSLGFMLNLLRGMGRFIQKTTP